MSELRRPLARLGDEELGAELRSLATWLDSPTVGLAGAPDPARRARLQIEALGPVPSRRWWPFGSGRIRPLRRSLVLAIVALIVLAAIVGAISLGVPGIRIIFTGGTGLPTPTPIGSGTVPSGSPGFMASPTPSGPPGSGLDLGILATPAETSTLAGFPLLLPTDPAIGAPDAIWYREGRLTLIWKSRPGLPDTQAGGIGLLVTEFRGRVNTALFQKTLGPNTRLTAVSVAGETGYWISGATHDFFYLDPNGEVIADSRRVVGDTLVWTRSGMTFRLETSLGQDAAIRIAETIR